MPTPQGSNHIQKLDNVRNPPPPYPSQRPPPMYPGIHDFGMSGMPDPYGHNSNVVHGFPSYQIYCQACGANCFNHHQYVQHTKVCPGNVFQYPPFGNVYNIQQYGYQGMLEINLKRIVSEVFHFVFLTYSSSCNATSDAPSNSAKSNQK